MSYKYKDPVQLLDEADGNPQWLREVLTGIFERLPPAPPPPPSAIEFRSDWDPKRLALLQIEMGSLPLTAKNRWYLAAWLKKLSQELTEGTLDEGDSKEGFRSLFVLRKDGGK